MTHADARSRLVASAEQLFAERGIDGVSLREITRNADQKNATALQYHFGDRDGILRALIAKHDPGIEERRHALLDDFEAHEPRTIAQLSAAYVLPLVHKLKDPFGGPEFLIIVAELMNGADRTIAEGDPLHLIINGSTKSTRRWGKLLRPLLPEGAVGEPLHRRFAAIRFAHVELGRRARSGPRRDDRLFTAHLVDLVGAILQAPLGPETQQLLDGRRRTTGQRQA